jgi:hypothetical protein
MLSSAVPEPVERILSYRFWKEGIGVIRRHMTGPIIWEDELAAKQKRGWKRSKLQLEERKERPRKYQIDTSRRKMGLIGIPKDRHD